MKNRKRDGVHFMIGGLTDTVREMVEWERDSGGSKMRGDASLGM